MFVLIVSGTHDTPFNKFDKLLATESSVAGAAGVGVAGGDGKLAGGSGASPVDIAPWD